MYPCSDYEHNHEEENEIGMSTHSDSHSNDCEGDLCSPFCVCACCQSLTTVNIKIFTLDTVSVSWGDEVSAFYKELTSFDYQEPLFHPPIA